MTRRRRTRGTLLRRGKPFAAHRARKVDKYKKQWYHRARRLLARQLPGNFGGEGECAQRLA